MTTASQVPEAKAAIGLFIEHHAANAGLTPALIDRLSFDPHPQMRNFLTRVATDNPNPATKEAAAAINKLVVGAVSPDITAKDTDGKEFKLSEYRGKVVLLDFWGHWCPPLPGDVPAEAVACPTSKRRSLCLDRRQQRQRQGSHQEPKRSRPN